MSIIFKIFWTEKWEKDISGNRVVGTYGGWLLGNIIKAKENDETFEVHINGTLKEQERYLFFRDKFIDKTLHITFGERSGVSRVPFHVKTVRLE